MICDRMNLLFIFYVQFIYSILFILMVSLFFLLNLKNFEKNEIDREMKFVRNVLTLRLIIICH